MKQLLAITFLTLSGHCTYCQEYLDVSKFQNCELFVEKKGYDRNERLKKIEELEGQLVTVYFVKGKNLQIKSKYTGSVLINWRDKNDISLKNKVDVLTVEYLEDGGRRASFPMTNDKSFRIYLTKCLEE